nr:type II toxin-antitoxin system RelE/ParE family toxin [Candidatus Freyarchaeota archaeon]
MTYRIFLHQKAKKALDKLDPKMGGRIREKIRELRELPRQGEHLRYSPFWKLRIGNYRVIYEIDEERRRVIILFIGHRRTVHDDFSKLL